MIGTITDVSCADAPQIQITLKAQTIIMRRMPPMPLI